MSGRSCSRSTTNPDGSHSTRIDGHRACDDEQITALKRTHRRIIEAIDHPLADDAQNGLTHFTRKLADLGLGDLSFNQFEPRTRLEKILDDGANFHFENDAISAIYFESLTEGYIGTRSANQNNKATLYKATAGAVV